jgi:hypothetical protein
MFIESDRPAADSSRWALGIVSLGIGARVIAAIGSESTAGSGWAFLMNAVSFFGVILFLYHWKPRETERRNGSETFTGAIAIGRRDGIAKRNAGMPNGVGSRGDRDDREQLAVFEPLNHRRDVRDPTVPPLLTSQLPPYRAT